MAIPILKMQVGTLYASGDDSTFTGTGGPWGFSPFTSQFGGLVSSAGLAGEPFNDVVYNVAAGDEVIFVIAVQNVTVGAAAYNVQVQAALPTGFVLPSEGTNLTVTDGTGTDLAISGDLFSNGGINIAAPLAGYDPNSGLNLVLITYALLAGTALPATDDAVTETATVTHAAATSGGPDVSSQNPASGSTVVMTAAPTEIVTAETDPSAVAVGQTVAFDVTIPVPSGTLQDLRLDTVLPSGTDSLSLVSATVLSKGSALSAGTPVVTAAGSVQFGTVSQAGSTTLGGGITAADNLVVRLVVRAAGTLSGPATLQTVLSAVDPNSPGGRFSATVSSSVGVVVPAVPPVFSGLGIAQRTAAGSILYPFVGAAFTSSLGASTAVSGTLAVTLQDGSLGKLVAPGLGSVDAAGDSFVAIGTLATLQSVARQIEFAATQPGTEHFIVTLVDGDGGLAQDGTTTATIAAAGTVALPPAAPALAEVSTAPAAAADTAVYQGPVDYVPAGGLPGGSGTVAVVAQASDGAAPGFINQAAATLASAQGAAAVPSNLLIGGSGADDIFVQAYTGASASETIVGFVHGDALTVFGFRPGVSSYTWVNTGGPAGYQGRTLQMNASGSGQSITSITFAGTNQTATNTYAITTGTAGSTPYLTITA